jgi:hypothetical protein
MPWIILLCWKGQGASCGFANYSFTQKKIIIIIIIAGKHGDFDLYQSQYARRSRQAKKDRKLLPNLYFIYEYFFL